MPAAAACSSGRLQFRNRFDLVERFTGAGALLSYGDRNQGLGRCTSVASAAFFVYHRVVGNGGPQHDSDFCEAAVRQAAEKAAALGNIPLLDFLLRISGAPLPLHMTTAADSTEAIMRFGHSSGEHYLAANIGAGYNSLAVPFGDENFSSDDDDDLHGDFVSTYRIAARHGCVGVMDWLFNNVPGGVPEEVLQQAVAHGCMDSVEWVTAHIPKRVVVRWAWFSYEADDSGELYAEEFVEVLDWLIQHYPPLTANATSRLIRGATKCVAKSQNMEIFHVLSRRGFVLDSVDVARL